MTDQEINVRLAKWAGATDIEIGRATWPKEMANSLEGVIFHESVNGGEIMRARIPSYTESLDAVHGLEANLSDEQWDDYTMELSDIVGCGMCNTKWLMRATARQRSLALVRALGLEGEPQ
jgi:hypothetical protein